MQGSARKDVVFGAARVYAFTVPGPKWKSWLKGAVGSYCRKAKNRPAFIALYTKNFSLLRRNRQRLSQMIPVLEFVLADTLFHEFGHHIQHTRSHGIKKKRGEQYAESYRSRLISTYVLATADDVNKCFDDVERTTESNSLALDRIRKFRQGWNKEYEKACRVARAQATDD